MRFAIILIYQNIEKFDKTNKNRKIRGTFLQEFITIVNKKKKKTNNLKTV